VVRTVTPPARACASMPVMDDGSRIVLRLEVDSGDHEPLTGAVCVPGGPEQEFSGWSELFAALQTLLAGRR
jgi:hypothetical protein